MASLYLVRHAQASFGSDDYDRLSSIGIRQARLAGRYLRARAHSLGRVITGSLRRHRDTATEVLTSWDSNRDVARTIDERLDELDSDALIRTLGPALDAASASWRDLREYQKALKQSFLRWQAVPEPPPPLESWSQFRSRVISAFEALKSDAGRGETTIVVSSAGVIACIVQHILGLPGGGVYPLFEVMKNASITHVLHDRHRASVASFNDCSYLYLDEAFQYDEQLVTYR